MVCMSIANPINDVYIALFSEMLTILNNNDLVKSSYFPQK